MNAQDNGGSAFQCLPPQDTAAGSAVGYPYPDAGMTLRDYFAAKAMQAFIASYERGSAPADDSVEEDAYAVADRMLKARKA